MTPIEVQQASVLDVNAHPSLRWGAVIAGWMVASGIALVLYVAGLAFGFQMFDPNDAAATAKGIGIGTVIWVALTWIASLFLGGMFASWFDGRDDATVGCMHGVTVWGLAIVMSGLLLALGLSGAAAGGAMLGGAAAGIGTSGDHGRGDSQAMVASSDAMVRLHGQVAQRIINAGGAGAHAAADPAAVASISTALLANHPDTASAVLAGTTGMSPADAEQSVRSLSPQVDAAKAELKAAADKTAHYTAMAMWTAFISLLLGLLAAALGGWLGAGHVHRVYHLRRYPRSVATSGP
ncbi:hypothetical protein [Frateuria terrea]|uniref:PhnA-like protein n=1 Tax=Frateuria terrea TaxID=529704 RepID=A0A1H6V6Z6_9GAMM|nr:hypothetical protein [Frateuria terrea]SEJ00373.1 hypothetical protein SAMN04487997_2162 [Frateuria terrea]SFP65663.1 hypothetical protein SAMN02927913_3068 [Frateuria terrea]